jgi:hypothetical protein
MSSLSVSDLASVRRFVQTLRDRAATRRVYEAALNFYGSYALTQMMVPRVLDSCVCGSRVAHVNQPLKRSTGMRAALIGSYNGTRAVERSHAIPLRSFVAVMDCVP